MLNERCEVIHAIHIKRDGLTEQQMHNTGWAPRSIGMAHAVLTVVQLLFKGFSGAPTSVILEIPANWAGGRGQASKDGGDIQKLYHTVGAIAGMLATSRLVNSIYVVEPGQWKGQAPKPIMVSRVQRLVPGLRQHDTAEAVLLGEYAFNRIDWSAMPTLQFISPLVAVAIGAPVPDISMFTLEEHCE